MSEDWTRGGRGKCHQEVMYERIINKNIIRQRIKINQIIIIQPYFICNLSNSPIALPRFT